MTLLAQYRGTRGRLNVILFMAVFNIQLGREIGNLMKQ